MDGGAGYGPLDPASTNQPEPDYQADLGKGVGGLKVGILRSFYKYAEGLSEETVFRAGQAYEQATDWHQQWPAMNAAANACAA